MIKRSDRIQKLVEETLDIETTLKVSELLRRSLRIARLQGDYRNIAWIGRELMPHEAQIAASDLANELLNYIPNLEVFRSEWDRDSKRFTEERTMPMYDKDGNTTDKTTILALTAPDIEQSIEGFIYERENTRIPNGALPGHVAMYNQSVITVRLQLTRAINDRQIILNHIRGRVITYLNQVEALISYQELNTDVFESAKRMVESELSAIAPDVLTKFNAAQERLSEGSSEAYSHALETCRRVLKTFADSLYPATDIPVVGKDGKERILNNDMYIGRLWQYLYDLTGHHASTDITLAVLDQIGGRIDKVYTLTNKGVHSDVIEYEAKQCVIQTFLLLSDILAFRKVSSSNNKDINPIHSNSSSRVRTLNQKR